MRYPPLGSPSMSHVETLRRTAALDPDADARNRFRAFCWIMLVGGLVYAGWYAFVEMPPLRTAAELPADVGLRAWARLAGFGIGLAVVAWFLVFQRRRLRTRAEVVNASVIMATVVAIVGLATRLLLAPAFEDPTAYPGWGIVDVVVLHLLLCATIPVTLREATIPFSLILLVWAGSFLVPAPSLDHVVAIMMSPAVLLPGGAIAGWRARRRREEAERHVLGEQVERMGGELSRARIVHDAMFPAPFRGHVGFEYEYHPIQEIGGDYVHFYRCARTERVVVTLLDVAGHGLAAALTVNRLYGELERILAENETAEPEEIMTLLNRYIFLTMAPHNLYATGLCVSLDPSTGRLRWVNAGHPPALLRRDGGGVADLPTTTVLLGALPPSEFETDQEETTLRPGDVVIAYTDGAFEARDARGHCLGMSGVREIASFSPPPRSWPRFIAGAVAQHHGGAVEDDVLIAAVTYERMLIGAESEAPEPARSAPRA